MSKVLPVPPPGQPSSGKIPPLREGDRLTRAEFHRRYEAMPELKKAELIEGVVYLPSPDSIRRHATPDFRVTTWLGHYVAGTPGVEGGQNGTVILDESNEPQPDDFLFIEPERGGQARISQEDFLEGAPELVAEVAASSVKRDLGPKKEAYRRNGVREYIVVRAKESAVDWFALRAGEYQPMLPDASGVLKSEVFPGLWLDAAALLRGDLPAVLKVLEEGLAIAEHAAFVAGLASHHP